MAAVFEENVSAQPFNGPYYLSIAGQLVETEATFPVVNPATGEVFAHAPAATAEQLDTAISAAKDAFRGWSALGYERR